ncbi:wax ester/triacylglycerol synthase family O-acyltransferase [Seohaeicola saemankumensis]|nr:wax ester/triacylglycerol synthase family O-acyltransferase [Seohaeicola saemankumensis]MCA0871096.1 wax ester/triacylglycerol synthase family O-acyltransferase [Seohaeicola saemankumensis]
MEHLSTIDASFLHLETPETPMHVASLMLLDLPEGYDGDFLIDLRTVIGKRMHLAKVLTRKLAPMPFELTEPVWIEDHEIDLEHHIRHLTLRKPGSRQQLDQLIARLHSMLLDRSRPLWELYVIEGLEDGKVGFYSKLHHSGIDGKAGVEFAQVLYDATAKIREVPPPRRSRDQSPYQLGVAELLQASFNNSVRQYRKMAEMMPATVNALAAANRIMINQRTQPGERPLNLGLAPKTIFNASITNQRSFSCFSLPMDEIKAAGKRVGGTINTVVMAMCSGALRGFLKDRGLLPKESLIAMVPASLRTADDDSMNNQVTLIRVDLATEIDDLPERFKIIHASSEAGKATVRELKPALSTEVPLTGTPWLMTGFASMVGRTRLVEQSPSLANVLISNVPGPPRPLFVAGARVSEFYPVSIPYHGTGLNITVQSYDGRLEFGLTACRRVLSQNESYELCDRMLKALGDIKALPSAEDTDTAAAEAPAEPKPAKAPAAKRKAAVRAASRPRGTTAK